ncbi:hypothetical protein Daus18300_000660 [Diaporthe australafricana]|uniref:Uncharacterized protein n=1 Tax=Diaporthe australafricana TaxID=127596 RepID=A0ABR3Y1S2_9PEZI
MATQEASTGSSWQNLQLDEHWRIGQQIPKDKESHAAVYFVLDHKTGLLAENLEAHVFVLDHAQPRLRKHRLRCIRRSKQRTKLELKVQDTVIIVISTLQAADIKASETDGPGHSSTNADRPLELEDSPNSGSKIGKLTPYQRESARTRQRERRRVRRAGKSKQQRSNTADEEPLNEQTISQPNLDDGDTEFATSVILLWILYDATGTMRKEIPQEHSAFIRNMGSDSLHESLEKYLNQSAVQLDSPEDLQSYLRAKRTEAVSMRRLAARVSGAEKYHREKLERVYREQAEHKKHSKVWQELEDGPKVEAVFQWKTVVRARSILPRILTSQKRLIRLIERKRSRAFEKMASTELSEQREKVARSVAQYAEWTSTVFPLSHSRGDLLRQLEAAKSELAALDSELQKHTLR